MRKKILLCVEGEKTEEKILNHLFEIYGLDNEFSIVSFKANIYQLYVKMFAGENADPENLDLIQVLKEREKDIQKRMLLNERYTDIFLIFDFDPQDHYYDSKHLKEMMQYFCESTDHGKLYLNYPMAEAFYHMSSIPDEGYLSKKVSMNILRSHGYKQLVHKETIRNNPDLFAINRRDCNTVIKSNRDKAWNMIGQHCKTRSFPLQEDILNCQCVLMKSQNEVYVLSTMVSFILEYDSRLVEE